MSLLSLKIYRKSSFDTFCLISVAGAIKGTSNNKMCEELEFDHLNLEEE